ncbi:DUF4179 domain-containing protein [Paenibacillus oryzisoli]|uniref:DUF4179 domain-containing protein n=1 Tax=Paenibacillus oryzisoli TaxID=1850517 RepID=UPI003D2CBBC4
MYNTSEQETAAELSDRIEMAIVAGIQQGQNEINRRRKQFRRRIGAAIAIVLLFLSCIFTIKVSPVFASMIRDIPGLEKFVDLINSSYDKGIKLAVNNEFIQPIGISEEQDGMKFTVQGVIADDARLVVFYEIQLSDKHEHVQLNRASLQDSTGKLMQASVSFNYPEEAKQASKKTGIQRGTADFQLSPGSSLTDELVLQVTLTKSESPNSSKDGTDFDVRFPIDRTQFVGLQHAYTLGQSIQVEGQSITFTKAVITPLQVSLYLDYDETNSKQIFGPGDIRLVDDKGIVWANTSASLVKDHPVYHFESPYFNSPKSLTIVGSWFRALDKNQMSIVIDTETEQLLQAPDKKLRLYAMTKSDSYMKLDFVLNGLDSADRMMYSLADGEFRDAAGNLYKEPDLHEITRGYVDGSKPGEQHAFYYIANQSYKQPLTLTLNDYPSYIRQPYQIRIK